MTQVVGYRVYVEEITLDEDGDNKYRTVVDLSAPADVLAQFAPAAVSRTLGVSVPAPLPVHVAEPDVVEGGEDVPAPEAPKAKRTRRTKEQIAADEAAKVAAQASVTTSFEGAAPVPAQEQSAPAAEPEAPAPAFNPFAPK